MKRYIKHISWLKLYSFLLPALVIVGLFAVYPSVYTLILSFQDADFTKIVRGTERFVGFANYLEVFNNTIFQRVLLNSLVFTCLSIFFQLIIGFLLALVFNRLFPLKGILQSFVLIPWAIPIMASATFFRWFFSDNGVLNGFLISWGLIRKPIPWITSPTLAIFSLILANIWLGIPFTFMLYYAGLSKIPVELYESAEVDGATGFQKVIYIIIPLLKPVTVTTIILSCIFTMKVFDLVWVVTRGSPGGASHLFSTLSYSLAFDSFRFGQSAVVLVVMGLIVMVLVSLLNRIKVEEL